MPQLRAGFGLAILLALAWLLSSDRRRFPLKVVLGGLALQYAFALFVLRTGVGSQVFDAIGRFVAVLIDASDQGAAFIFGGLVRNEPDKWGFVFAAKALPTIIVFSSLSAIGYHLGILQRVVGVFAWVMARLMGVSGAESMCAAANVFMGQTEAPLFVRPFIPKMTQSELNAVMIAGFATIAGSLMAVYAGMLGHSDSAAVAAMAKHLLTASLISSPASLAVAKILLPETGEPVTAGRVRIVPERTTRNLIDAASTGAADGMKLAINVAAMLIAFIALVALIDKAFTILPWIDSRLGMNGGPVIFGPLGEWLGIPAWTLDGVLGRIFTPIAWLIGIDGAQRQPFASLLGKAMAANEFLAYKSLGEFTQSGTLDPRSVTLAVYALCGFANFSSIGIQIAGIGGMAPERYHDLARLGLRAMLGGAIACWMTACVGGTLIE